MTILLTGSTGFIGSHVKIRLEKDGHNVICYRRDEDLPVEKIDAVINCAADVLDHSKMEDSNIGLVQKLLSYSRNKNVSKVIQIGSSSEIGRVEGERRETDYCNPSNLYEATKLAATNLCLGYASEYGMDISVARPFTVYGKGEKTHKMIPAIWRAFCEREVFKCAPAGHDWIHVDDLVDGIIIMLLAPKNVTKGQVFHFGTGKNTSNEQIVRLFEKATGSRINVKIAVEKLKSWDVTDWRADWSKAKNNLNWTPKISIEQGIHKLVNENGFTESSICHRA